MTASRSSIDETAPGSLRASGVVDAHTAESLESALAGQEAGSDIKLDLSAVDFIDSSGLRVIVAHHHRLDGAGQQLLLSGTSEAVERLFEITGLKDHLHISS